jgi:hypothetical protein
MDYLQHHLRDWLLSGLGKKARLPKGTLRHFKKERVQLPLKHVGNLVAIITNYGYTSLNDE